MSGRVPAGKARLTIDLPEELVEELRDTVSGLPDHPAGRPTLTLIVQEAFEDVLRKYREMEVVIPKYDGTTYTKPKGERFPRRRHDLPVGRPSR